MTQSQASTKDLRALLEVGFSIQAVDAFVSFCLKHERSEELKKLRELIESSVASLSPEERKELSGDMDALLREKADRLLDDLEATHSQEEIDELVAQLANSSPLLGPTA